MTNFIQMLSVDDASQLYPAEVHASSQSQYCSAASQTQSSAPASSPDASCRPATITAADVRATPKLNGSTHYFIRGNPNARLALSTYEQAPCVDVPAPDSALPNRPTCAMPYHTMPGVDRLEHSANASCRFYLACPARIQGLYHTESVLHCKGIRNGKGIAVHFWEDAEEEWALACLRWHGDVCPNTRPRVNMETRIHLNPALAEPQVERWAVRGIPGKFGSRRLAFEAAAAKDMKEIQILGSVDDAALASWSKATVILY
ncbi:hypothetical protein C8R47DRAFT_1074139 [Mycena vitilis]|nr:hypothetical protein C8R47DRAFT_1074139 [Mycena vitilis]